MYYIEVNPEQHKSLIIIRRTKLNLIEIECQPIVLTIYFNRYMVYLSEDVIIKYRGAVIKKFRVQYHEDVINETIEARKDANFIFEDKVVLNLMDCPNQKAAPIEVHKEIEKNNIQKESNR